MQILRGLFFVGGRETLRRKGDVAVQRLYWDCWVFYLLGDCSWFCMIMYGFYNGG